MFMQAKAHLPIVLYVMFQLRSLRKKQPVRKKGY
jgi:hypothetical protein